MDPPNHVVIKVDTDRERYTDRGSTVMCYPVRKVSTLIIKYRRLYLSDGSLACQWPQCS